MNENELYVVKKSKFDNQPITEIDSKLEKSFKDCHNKYFHKFKFDYIYDIAISNFTNN